MRIGPLCNDADDDHEIAYVHIIEGISILHARDSHICHQCNCVTKHAKGLAKSIFTKFPYADTYSKSNIVRKCGTIHVKSRKGTCHPDDKVIINMYAQHYPGKNKYNKPRQTYFQSCLDEIVKIQGITSIAMPWNIGCGLAGGNWNIYFLLIRRFARSNKIHVTLYNINK